MPSANDFPARGTIKQFSDGFVVFVPANSNYELKLSSDAYAGRIGAMVEGMIRVKARRLWTVSSGGNFVSPIFGPPKTIQGRVIYVDQQVMVVHAGVNIVVELPAGDAALDLGNGGIGEDALVNVVAFSGATFEPVQPAVVK